MIFMLVGGSIAELIGRKRTLIIGQSCILVGWTTMFLAKRFPILLIGRLIIGAGIGVCLPTSTLQLSEISLIKMRGTLSMMGYLVMNAGAVNSLISAANFSIHTVMILSILPPVVFLLTCYFLPESPVWLMKKGYTEKARLSLLSLRGPDYDMNHELKEIEDLVTTQDDSGWLDKLKKLHSRENAIPFAIISVIFILQV